MSNVKITVIIPAYNAARTLPYTITSIIKQDFTEDVEIIVYDDCSTDNSYQIARHCESVETFRNEINLGPAKTRNNAIRQASADILAFIDSDCVAGDNWLKNINKSFQDKTLKVIQGRVKIPQSTYLGDCISAQGFPGGGLVGFEKMWLVDKNGFTDHITSCNFAIRKEVFQEHGYFDESFPFPGNEDSELSYRLTQRGVKIKYCPDLLVYHEPREDLISFIKWMFSRGRSNYYFKKKVGSVRSFVMLRLWSSKNIITNFAFDRKLFLIAPLMFLSFVLQQAGYIFESSKQPVGNKQKMGRSATR